METNEIEEIRSPGTEVQKLPSHWDQMNVPGLQPSMSISDLVNHIGQCISEHMTSCNPILPGGDPKGSDILEEITQYLLSDTQLASASDENSLMSRVNSLCCLLQKDHGAAQNLQAKSHGDFDVDCDTESNSITATACQSKFVEGLPVPDGESNNVSGRKRVPAMSRKDSVGDLLLNLPRIASLPQFLYNI